jgi:hypothetical protein
MCIVQLSGSPRALARLTSEKGRTATAPHRVGHTLIGREQVASSIASLIWKPAPGRYSS